MKPKLWATCGMHTFFMLSPMVDCGFSIVWSVDLREDVKADESSGSTHKTSTPIIKQVIKIWAVATHAGVESSNWAALAKQSKARSAEYRRKYVVPWQIAKSMLTARVDAISDRKVVGGMATKSRTCE